MGLGLLHVRTRGHHNESVLEVSAPSRRRHCPNLWRNLRSGLPAPNRHLRLYRRRRHVSYPIQSTRGMNSSMSIIRWDRWQCSCKPFDGRHQHPSARPRSWWEVSCTSVIHHARSPHWLNRSNQGVLASIIPLLFYALSPDTVSPITRRRVSFVHK